jgi:hypothetical protein
MPTGRCKCTKLELSLSTNALAVMLFMGGSLQARLDLLGTIDGRPARSQILASGLNMICVEWWETRDRDKELIYNEATRSSNSHVYSDFPRWTNSSCIQSREKNLLLRSQFQSHLPIVKYFPGPPKSSGSFCVSNFHRLPPSVYSHT